MSRQVHNSYTTNEGIGNSGDSRNEHSERIDRLYSYVANTNDIREELPDVKPVDREWLTQEVASERYLWLQDIQQNDLR